MQGIVVINALKQNHQESVQNKDMRLVKDDVFPEVVRTGYFIGEYNKKAGRWGLNSEQLLFFKCPLFSLISQINAEPVFLKTEWTKLLIPGGTWSTDGLNVFC